MKNHLLKTHKCYFEAVLQGDKTFEIRLDDRGYKVGDTVTLREFDGCGYTGREYIGSIGYITNYEQRPGYIVFSLLPRYLFNRD